MTKTFKVAVVGRDLCEHMFTKRGFKLVSLLGGDIPDLVQFTGGEDVDPALYGHKRHSSTRSNPRRDSFESNIYQNLLGKSAFAGICRGGQLLNVLNGGTMYQHVNNHGRDHMAHDLLSQRDVLVTSTHHQMMIPAPTGQVVMVAKESSVRWLEEDLTHPNHEAGDVDVEAIFYPETRSLCFQPHPEYLSVGEEGQEIYFEYLKNLLNIG